MRCDIDFEKWCAVTDKCTILLDRGKQDAVVRTSDRHTQWPDFHKADDVATSDWASLPLAFMAENAHFRACLLYTSPSPRDCT